MSKFSNEFGITMSVQLANWVSYYVAGTQKPSDKHSEQADEIFDTQYATVDGVAADSKKNWPIDMTTDFPKFDFTKWIMMSKAARVSLDFNSLSKAYASAILTIAFSITEAGGEIDRSAIDKAVYRSYKYLEVVNKPTETGVFTGFDSDVSTSKDMNYELMFNEYSDVDKAEIGYVLLKNGQEYRKAYKGRRVEISTSSGKILPVYIALESDEVDEYLVTFNRAVIGTAIQTAKKQAELKQISKIGANVGWNSLYKYSTSIKTYLSKMSVDFEEFYIPLVCIPRSKPSSLTVSLKGSEYMFLTFSMINDIYNISVSKQAEKVYSFTAGVVSKLKTENIVFDTTKAITILKKVAPVCFKYMKHAGSVPVELIDSMNSLLNDLKSGRAFPEVADNYFDN